MSVVWYVCQYAVPYENTEQTSVQATDGDPTNHRHGPSHVTDDVRGVSAECSRSSSRSSGFDENSSTVTDCNLLPVFAHNDRPEMTLSEMEDTSGEKGTSNEKPEDCDADSLNTLRVISADDVDTGQQESCSSQVKDERLEELRRQIENMSERFNRLVARVKSTDETRPSATSLTDVSSCPTDNVYSRNTYYRRWLDAKSTLQPIIATDDVVMTTEDANWAVIGQQTGDDVFSAGDTIQQNMAASRFDDVMKTAFTEDVTSEIDESQEQETERRDTRIDDETSWCRLDAERTSELHENDLKPTLNHDTCGQEMTLTVKRDVSELQCQSSVMNSRLGPGPADEQLTTRAGRPHPTTRRFNSHPIRSDQLNQTSRPSRLLRPAASYDSMPRHLPIRRRSVRLSVCLSVCHSTSSQSI